MIQKIRDNLLDILAPGPYICFLCGNESIIGEDGLCAACRELICFCPSPVWLPPLDGLRIGLNYTDAVKSAVLRLKTGKEFVYAAFLAQYMEIPKEWNSDILVPVPMHPLHEFLRGFNHSALLAEYLSSEYGIPYTNDLLYKKKLSRQQKRLAQRDRRKNVRNTFYAEPACKGLRIVLIDDVFTTGSTVYECAKTLKQAGAHSVYACCAASPSR